MGRLKITGSGLMVGLAVLAMCAGQASATKPRLVLREGGPHLHEGLDPAVPDGAWVEVSLETELGGCSTTGPAAQEMPEYEPLAGEIRENDTSTVLVDTASERAPCSDEYEGKRDEFEIGTEPSGAPSIELSAKGKEVRFLWDLHIFVWGPYGPQSKCSYAFQLLKAKSTFPVPAPGAAGSAVVKGTVKSVGHQEPPDKLCPKKQSIAFTVTLADNGGYPLETTLEG